MMWCASHIKEISDRVRKLKEEQAGTYLGLELRENNNEVARATGNTSVVSNDMTLDEDKQPVEKAAEDKQKLIKEEKPTETGDLLDINP